MDAQRTACTTTRAVWLGHAMPVAGMCCCR